MEEPIKAYIAGLLDGEGCYRIDRFRTERSPIGFQYRTTVEITMCDKEPIEFLAKATSKNFSIRKIKSGRTIYTIIWRNGIAANLIREIFPYIIGKRKQAELCLYFEDHVTPGRGRTYTVEGGKRCEEIRIQVRDLKYIGVLRC